jgi:hypothetical protein
VSALIRLLALLLTHAQKKLPHTLPGVDSNDVLYGGGPEYMAELKEKFTAVLELVSGGEEAAVWVILADTREGRFLVSRRHHRRPSPARQK